MTPNQLKHKLKEMGFRRWIVTERMMHATTSEHPSGVVIAVPCRILDLGLVRLILERDWPVGIGMYVEKLPFWKCWMKRRQWKIFNTAGYEFGQSGKDNDDLESDTISR